MTSSRTADRRALPASSRNGVSLNSTVRGTLYEAMRSSRNAMTPASSSPSPCTMAFVEVAEVAERVPPVAALRGGTDVAVCRRAARRRPHVDLADHARRALVAVVVEDLHLASDDDADRPAALQPLPAADEGRARKFRPGVQLPHHFGSEQFDPSLLDGGWA